ncbi:hypothetical protein HPB49_019808 [Dermacentor silvarum]|uniref:Uncharacterized protein n=1 Tax=Dermacentor silvarum TaxID=543639 RepID=A0ACB8CSY2_DERSI|nr:hypothetical protein HPB49_019808 [Dermacentor silvarum]
MSAGVRRHRAAAGEAAATGSLRQRVLSLKKAEPACYCLLEVKRSNTDARPGRGDEATRGDGSTPHQSVLHCQRHLLCNAATLSPIEACGRGSVDGPSRVVACRALALCGLSCRACPVQRRPTTRRRRHKTALSPRMAVLVNVSMKIVDVDDINEKRMDFRLHTYIEESWRDHRLRSSPFAQRWRRMSVPRRVARLMWAPDVVFSNTKRSSIFRQSVDSVAYKIARDGSVHRLTRQVRRFASNANSPQFSRYPMYLFQVRCLMTFHKYPMDIQHCHFKVSLLATPNSITELSWDGNVDDQGESRAIEFVERVDQVRETVGPRLYSKNYTHLLANFTFERRLTASIVNTYIPSGLVVVLSWLSFWLDVHAVQGRITLGVTAILTLTTQVVQSRTALPPVDYVKAVDIWLFACLISVFTSLLEYAVAYQYVKSQRIVSVQDYGIRGVRQLAQFGHPAMAKAITHEEGHQDRSGLSYLVLQGFQGDGAMADEDITDNDMLGSAGSMESTVSRGNLPAPSRFPIQPLLQPNKLLAFVAKFRFLSISSSNVFDSVSRAMFPSVFVLFMIAYWAHYLPSGKPGH